jgi:hypothetical protein
VEVGEGVGLVEMEEEALSVEMFGLERWHSSSVKVHSSSEEGGGFAMLMFCLGVHTVWGGSFFFDEWGREYKSER